MNRETVNYNGIKCEIEKATPIGGYSTLDNYDVILTDLQKSVSQSGNDMFVATVYIVLAFDADKKTLIADKRRLYKAGEYQMAELRDALTLPITEELAKSGSDIKFITDDTLLSMLKNKEVVISADIVRGSNNQLNITLLF